jgi:two-component system, NarL family, sensor histidine kinase UhpB
MRRSRAVAQGPRGSSDFTFMHARHDRKLTLVTDTDTGTRDSLQDSSMLRRLLRFPLFYKILVANVGVLALVAVGCALVTRSAAANESINFAFVVTAGLALSVVSNALILRLALSPLRQLEDTARRVRSGDADARIVPTPLADRDFERVAETFNMMLDSAQAYRQRLREVAARALNAQEEERKRIARELHDGIAQSLAALRVRLRMARSADAESAVAALERISADLGEATEELRRIAQGLRPPALDMLGLAPAIESCARSINDTTGLMVDTDMGPVGGQLTSDAELALYRIVQEALSNAARHAGARTARVSLDAADGVVTAVVSDDGHGFSVEAEMARGGLGLFGMQERGAYVGGSVQIESEPGAGTRIVVTIPTLETARYA